MRVDPLSTYNIVSSGGVSSTEDKPKKRSNLVAVIVIIILLLLLALSIFLLSTRTSFFNFASELATGETSIDKSPTPSPTESTLINTATVSATNVETTTTSTNIPIPVSTASPTSTPSSVSVENSYIFASPLSAATGNVEKIRITVYILDGTGAGVSGKIIHLNGVNDLALTSIQPTTDSTGKATFDVAAGTSGSYVIGAAIGETSLNQDVTVTFN